MTDCHCLQIDDTHSFDLKQVSWGYRHIHRYVLEHLARDGVIGRRAPRVTDALLGFLHQAIQYHFEGGSRDLLKALDGRHRWLMRLPDLFERLCGTVMHLARTCRVLGARLLRYWGEGRFGDEPERLAHLLELLRRLTPIDPQLAAALMEGYPTLIDRLSPRQIDRFVDQLGPIHRNRPQTAFDYAALRLRSAHIAMDDLADEARLDDMRPRLLHMVRAVAGRDVEIESINQLDSDHLIDRGSTVVCLEGHLYLPTRVIRLGDRRDHEDAYRTMSLVAAATLRWCGFPTRQGRPFGPATLSEWCGEDTAWSATVWLIEIRRIVDRLSAWPGATWLVAAAIKREFANRPPVSATDRLLHDVLIGGTTVPAVVQTIRDAACRTDGVRQTRELAQKSGALSIRTKEALTDPRPAPPSATGGLAGASRRPYASSAGGPWPGLRPGRSGHASSAGERTLPAPLRSASRAGPWSACLRLRWRWPGRKRGRARRI